MCLIIILKDVCHSNELAVWKLSRLFNNICLVYLSIAFQTKYEGAFKIFNCAINYYDNKKQYEAMLFFLVRNIIRMVKKALDHLRRTIQFSGLR